MKIAIILAVLILSGCGGITFAPPDPGDQYMLDRQQDQMQAQMYRMQQENEYNYQEFLAPPPRFTCTGVGDMEFCN